MGELLTKCQFIGVYEAVLVSRVVDIEFFITCQEVLDMVITANFSHSSRLFMDLSLCSTDAQIYLLELFLKRVLIVLVCIFRRILDFLEMA